MRFLKNKLLPFLQSAGRWIVNFVVKHKVFFIVLAAIILISIPLCITAPGLEDFVENIPQDFAALKAKKESDTFNSIGIMSAYKVQKQLSISEVEQVTLLGIAGQVINTTGNSFTTFFVNFVCWLPSLLQGAWITIALTVCSVAAGVICSIFMALGKMSRFKPLSMICRAYIFFFRGTPLLMQLYFLWFGLPLIFPKWLFQADFWRHLLRLRSTVRHIARSI